MFKSRWWVVFASVLALIVGQGSIMVFGTGVFIKPVAQQLHFGRGVIASAMSLALIVVAVMNPFTGRMLDRRGFRVVLLPLLALFALATAALSLLASSVLLLLLLFAIQGVVATAATPTPYTKMITTRFDDCRGLALGITQAGVGLGVVLLPQFARILLQHFGWRMGYVGLGCAVMVLAFIPVAIWFGDPIEVKLAREKSRTIQQSLPGVEFSEAVRRTKFWAITIAITLGCMAINGTLIHVVPLLTDRGFTVARAVDVMSTGGLALIVGRIITGYLLDKIFASYVAIFILLGPMIGIALLGFGLTGAAPIIAVILLGIGVGAEHDLIAFLLSRYFGAKAFGAMHGLAFSFIVSGVALASSFMGWSHQLRHSYNLGFVLFEIFLAISIILLARLGTYRFPAVKPSQVRSTEAMAVSRP